MALEYSVWTDIETKSGDEMNAPDSALLRTDREEEARELLASLAAKAREELPPSRVDPDDGGDSYRVYLAIEVYDGSVDAQWDLDDARVDLAEFYSYTGAWNYAVEVNGIGYKMAEKREAAVA